MQGRTTPSRPFSILMGHCYYRDLGGENLSFEAETQLIRDAGHPVVMYTRDNREIEPEGQIPIPAGIPTLTGLLRKAGYATALIGKWGLGFPGSEGEPNAQGFDYFYGYNCQRKAHNYYRKRKSLGRRVNVYGIDRSGIHYRINSAFPVTQDNKEKIDRVFHYH